MHSSGYKCSQMAAHLCNLLWLRRELRFRFESAELIEPKFYPCQKSTQEVSKTWRVWEGASLPVMAQSNLTLVVWKYPLGVKLTLIERVYMFIVDYLFLVLGRFVFYLLRRIGFKIDLDKNSNYEDSMLTLAGFLLFCLIGFVIYLIWRYAKEIPLIF